VIADRQLYRCGSCARRVQELSGAGVPCQFCGGLLSPVWGLGQLATPRDDRDHPSLRRELLEEDAGVSALSD
jgi:hypothetical protein